MMPKIFLYKETFAPYPPQQIVKYCAKWSDDNLFLLSKKIIFAASKTKDIVQYKMLEIKNLHASIDGKEILKGINLEIEKGKVYAIMGSNGSGKSAFANYILSQKLWDGKPITVEQGGNDRIFNAVKLKYQNGKVLFGGKSTKKMEGAYLV